VILKVSNTQLSKSKYFIKIEDIPEIQYTTGLLTKILVGLHGEKVMILLNKHKPQIRIPTQTHENELIGIIIQGKGRYMIGDEEKILTKGDIYHVPPNIPHCTEVLGNEPLIEIDIFAPPLKRVLDAYKEAVQTTLK